MPQSEQKNQEELVKLAQSGDGNAFDLLVRQSAERIYNLSLRLTGNRTTAEDLSQDAFIRAYKSIAKFRNECSFSTWLYKITINLWKNRIKYEKRRAFLRHFSLDKPVETEDGELVLQIADPAPDPAAITEQEDKNKLVQKTIDELDEKTRVIIVLRDMDNKSYEEISELLECPLGTVKSRLARAREELRKKFVKCYREFS